MRPKWAALVLLAAVTLWINYRLLNEAYGAGPPYYGRTTNMDKWSSPVLPLLVLDGAMVGVASWLLRRR